MPFVLFARRCNVGDVELESVKTWGTPGAFEERASLAFGQKVTGLLVSHSRAPWLTIEPLAGCCAFIAATWLSPYYWAFAFLPKIYVPAAIYGLSFMFFGLGLGIYDREVRFSLKATFSLGFIAAVMSFLATLVAVYFMNFWSVGRYTLILGTLGFCLTMILTRVPVALYLRRNPRRVIFLGEPGSVTEEIRGYLSHPKTFYVHQQKAEASLRDRLGQDPVGLLQLLSQEGVAEIILTEGARESSVAVDFAIQAMHHGLKVQDEKLFYAEQFERYPVKSLSQNWFLFTGLDTHQSLTNFVKRAFDLVLAVVGLIVLMPLLTLIALLIKVTSAGPVFFFQERQGRFLKPFRIIKFRTMKLVPENAPSGAAGPPSTRVGDARVTAIGRWIRPLHLDELPQLWNIIRGEMSFVGPRPEALEFVNQIKVTVPIYELRHLLRPGLTGPSQLHLGYTLDNEEDTWKKLSYDFYYLKNYSLTLDLLLLMRTAFYLAKGSR